MVGGYWMLAGCFVLRCIRGSGCGIESAAVDRALTQTKG